MVGKGESRRNGEGEGSLNGFDPHNVWGKLMPVERSLIIMHLISCYLSFILQQLTVYICVYVAATAFWIVVSCDSKFY